MRITQLNCKKICRAHRKNKGQLFYDCRILPNNCCPYLYHSLYPYFLGLAYGAKFDLNKKGDVNVACPALKGVDCIVKRRKNNGLFGVGDNVKWVTYAEVTHVHKYCCSHLHKIGDRIIFPNVMKDDYMCPAAFNNMFPLLDLYKPMCLDKKNLRCPDSKDTVRFKIEEEFKCQSAL